MMINCELTLDATCCVHVALLILLLFVAIANIFHTRTSNHKYTACFMLNTHMLSNIDNLIQKLMFYSESFMYKQKTVNNTKIIGIKYLNQNITP